jgi:hypothetical protein
MGQWSTAVTGAQILLKMEESASDTGANANHAANELYFDLNI